MLKLGGSRVAVNVFIVHQLDKIILILISFLRVIIRIDFLKLYLCSDHYSYDPWYEQPLRLNR